MAESRVGLLTNLGAALFAAAFVKLYYDGMGIEAISWLIGALGLIFVGDQLFTRLQSED